MERRRDQMERRETRRNGKGLGETERDLNELKRTRWNGEGSVKTEGDQMDTDDLMEQRIDALLSRNWHPHHFKHLRNFILAQFSQFNLDDHQGRFRLLSGGGRVKVR